MRMKVQYHNIKNSTYQDVWDFQSLLHNDLKSAKRSPSASDKTKANFVNHLIFCEHKPVYTLGKSASADHLLIQKPVLENQGVEVFDINRGGDITYHGPGQLTAYLIFNLELLYRDVHRFVRTIEECIIQYLESHGLEAFRLKDYTGVWLGDSSAYHKICAIGVHLSRWVSMHGFAFNINTDLSYFNNIIPCGIADKNKSVTSLSRELGREISREEVEADMKKVIARNFELEYL